MSIMSSYHIDQQQAQNILASEGGWESNVLPINFDYEARMHSDEYWMGMLNQEAYSIWQLERRAKSIEADLKAFTELQEKRLRQLTRKIAFKRHALTENMKTLEIHRLKGKIPVKLSLGIDKSVEIIDETEIPEKFKNVKIINTVNKSAIKKAGGCQGARIVENDRLKIG